MTKAQQTISFALLVSSVRKLLYLSRFSLLTDPQVYLACFLGLLPLGATIQDQVIPVVSLRQTTLLISLLMPAQLPLWAIVSFGAYLLFKLGWGVFTFNDVPEAYNELMEEIEIAKVDLRKRGVEVD